MAGNSPRDRWATIEAMPPEDFAPIAERVSVCGHCLGPALLTDEELTRIGAEPLCTRCRRVLEEVA